MMRLPDGGNELWPPRWMEDNYNRWAILSAWYSGDPNKLASVYGGTVGSTHPYFSDPHNMRNSAVDSIQRWWWGTPTPEGELRAKPHVPIAGDIAAYSADLLFSEMPKIYTSKAKTNKRLQEIIDRSNLNSVLLEGAEVASPLGDVYLVVTWDTEFAEHPFIRAVHADAAVPEFRWGKLHAVTFWHVLQNTGDEVDVWRHLELHEKGYIHHAVYKGSVDSLGARFPLDRHPATAHLPTTVDTGIDQLTAVHVPNMLPNRDSRSSNFGRSDFSTGTLTLMDALDESYASWMRDIDLGKARLFIPREMLENNGPGEGARFNREQHIFTPISSPLPPDNMLIQESQFKIRGDEHERVALDLIDKIISSCGYSATSVSTRDTKSEPLKAAEVHAVERRSFMTRDKKARYWKAALTDIVETLLAVDAEVFNSKTSVERPKVEFVDAVQEQTITLAQTAQYLRAANAASTKTLIQMVHPDWDESQVEEEINRIEQPTPQEREKAVITPKAPNLAAGSDDTDSTDENVDEMTE